MEKILPPYSFELERLPESPTTALAAGQYQAIHFTVLDPNRVEWLLEKLEQWFAERDEVYLVTHGNTFGGLGFIVMEWEECEIDPLFLAILHQDELIEDISVYLIDGSNTEGVE